MNLVSKIARNTTLQLIARGFTSLANFVIILLIAKSLGSFGLGQYNKAFAFIGAFSLFVDFGLSAFFLKKGKGKFDFVLLILLRLAIAFVIFVLIQPILYFLPYNASAATGFSPTEKFYIEIVSLSLFLYAFIHSFYAIFQKRERFDLNLWPNLAYAVVALLVAVVSFSLGNLLFFFLATILGLFLQAFVAAFLVFKRLGFEKTKQIKDKMSYGTEFIKSLFRRSLPLGATLFLNVLYVRADVLILSFFRPTSEVGIYSLAYKFFEFPLNISFFIMTALYPVFLKTRKKSRPKFYRQIKKITASIFVFSSVMAVAALVFAPLIQIVKQEFVSSILPLRILALSYPVFFLSNLYLWTAIVEDRENILPIIYSLSLVLNIVLNIVFIPTYGYNAAAVATVVSETFVLGLFVFFLKNVLV